MVDMKYKRVVVLCGGDGPEREVSLNSGREVLAALKTAGFEAELVDLKNLADTREAVKNFDVAFIAMHGGWGEAGGLQFELNRIGVPYTGSSPDACSIAMNKARALERFTRAGLTIPKGILLTGIKDCEPDEIFDELGRDLVVKPCGGGSTVGVTILHDATKENLLSAVKIALDSYENDAVLVESYIAGRELTVAVLERDGRDSEPVALPVIEIAPHTGFYDFANKYTKGATEYLVPAPISDEIAARVREAAVTAHKCLGCRVYSRADFRLAPDGTPYVLEVNTAPGMTATSLVPKAARSAGIEFPDLVAILVNAAR